jgi:hypothetical protein
MTLKKSLAAVFIVIALLSAFSSCGTSGSWPSGN